MSLVTPEQVDSIFNEAKLQDLKLGEKTSMVICTLKSGFEIVETASCVNKENYDHEFGKALCVKKIKNRIWEYEGYVRHQKEII